MTNNTITRLRPNQIALREFIRRNAAETPTDAHLDALIAHCARIETIDWTPTEVDYLARATDIDWGNVERILRTPRSTKGFSETTKTPIGTYADEHPAATVHPTRIACIPVPLTEPPPHPWMHDTHAYEACMVQACWSTMRGCITRTRWPGTSRDTPDEQVPPVFRPDNAYLLLKNPINGSALPVGHTEWYGDPGMTMTHARETFSPRLAYLRNICADRTITALLPDPQVRLAGIGALARTATHTDAAVQRARANIIRIAAQSVREHLIAYCLAMLLGDATAVLHFHRLLDLCTQTIPLCGTSRDVITVLTLTA